jgi:hypothetical protein
VVVGIKGVLMGHLIKRIKGRLLGYPGDRVMIVSCVVLWLFCCALAGLAGHQQQQMGEVEALLHSTMLETSVILGLLEINMLENREAIWVLRERIAEIWEDREWNYSSWGDTDG